MTDDNQIVKEQAKILDDFLIRITDDGFSGTILVSKNDDIILQKGYGYADVNQKREMSSDTLLSVGSISKQFTATAIMKLIEKKLLTVNTTLDKLLDNVPDDKKTIYIYHLLTHTSGLPPMYKDDFDEIPKMEYLKGVFNLELQSEPGKQFDYSNIGYSLLGIIIEKLTNKPYQDYMIEEIFYLAEMYKAGWFEDDRWSEHEVANYYVDGEHTGSILTWKGLCWPILGNGGVCTNVQEMFNWIQALKYNKIISKKSLERIFTPFMEEYGFGWDVYKDDNMFTVYHNGGSTLGVSSFVEWDIRNDIIVIVLSNVILNGQWAAFLMEHGFKKLVYDNLK
ncbi:MAG: serine hydrolase [Asgard group archaeon]|nr:serine hydrolase [Asgard group archaeon]